VVTQETDPIEAGYSAGISDPAAAAAWCERYARRHSENFSVVTRFLPKRLHASMYTVYAYCRFTDDLGDEAAGDRLALLNEWESELGRAYAGQASHPISVALSEVVDEFQIDRAPFARLIEANRRDQTQFRYETYQDVLDYCSYSANPVGEMVLALFGHREPYQVALSDRTCTALQLANHWQDVARDFDAGRIYLPQEDLRRFGVSEDQIAAKQASAGFRAMMRFEVDRAEALFRQGAPLVDEVDRELRLDLRLFTSGGRAVLRAIEKQDYDVLRKRPRISGREKAWLLLGVLARRYALGG
jgi:squalene synthase HpnC